jgi:hypothetical protein
VRVRVGLVVRSLEVRLLRPRGPAARKYVDRTGPARGVVGLVAVDPGGAARFARGTDHQNIAVQRDRLTKVVAGPRVRALEIRLLAPRPPGPNERVDRAGTVRGVIGLIATTGSACQGSLVRPFAARNGATTSATAVVFIRL